MEAVTTLKSFRQCEEAVTRPRRRELPGEEGLERKRHPVAGEFSLR